MYNYPDTLIIFDSDCNETLKSLKDRNLNHNQDILIGQTIMVKCHSECNKSS